MAVKLQLRYDTAANWITNNPTLLAGEIGIESDTKKMKVGDGTHSWTSVLLPYAFVTSTSPDITTSITTPSTIFSLIDTTATTLYFARAASTITMGATGGSGLTIQNSTITATGATSLSLGASTGTFTIGNPTITATNATALALNGSNPSITTTSTGTASIFDGNAVSVNIGAGATTAVNIGSTTAGAAINLESPLYPRTGTATAGTAPLVFTSGVNLGTAVAGAMEYDGYVSTITPNTNIGRGIIPTTVYTSGQGTSLTASSESTAVALFPGANDTITLPIGYYSVQILFRATRGSTSTTSATARINFRGSGTAAGTFYGTAYGYSGSAATTGTPTVYQFMGSNITADNVVSPATTTAAGDYYSVVSGTLKITTTGTIIPTFSLSANIAAGSATAPNANNAMIIQPIQMGTSIPASTGGWA